MEEKFTSLNLTLDECKEKHICPVCGKILSKTHKVFCSIECKNSEIGRRIIGLKFKMAAIRLYGVDNVSQCSQIKDKKKQSSLKRYGTVTPLQSEEVKEKIKETNLKKYGVENVSQNESIKKKKVKTTKEHYGVENIFCHKSVKDAIKQKYGVENVSQNESIKKKKVKTTKEHYGVENPFQSKEVKEKIKETNLKKYGESHSTKSKVIRRKIIESFRNNNFENFVTMINQKGLRCLFNKTEYLNVICGTKLKFKCEHCGNEFNYIVDKYGLCVHKINCTDGSHKSTSHYEHEIYEWLKSIGIENIERNKRDWNREKVFEADIFLPDYNLAIEFNGIYWHSNLYRDKDYHLNKWKFFKEQNIDCIQIFENEWILKKDIVKNIILNKLNLLQPLNETDYHLDSVGDEEFNSFLQQNSFADYIDLDDNKLGIYIADKELIQFLSYSILDDKIMIKNFCTKLGISFTEGLIAFTNYLKHTYNKDIYIEIDCRYFDRNDFKDFKFVEHTEPKCYYFKNNENIFYENKIDNDDCLSIYDCGNDILVF